MLSIASCFTPTDRRISRWIFAAKRSTVFTDRITRVELSSSEYHRHNHLSLLSLFSIFFFLLLNNSIKEIDLPIEFDLSSK